MANGTIDAVIVAGGAGTRMETPVPKAFVPLAGKPLLTYALSAFGSHDAITNIVLVVPSEMINEAQELCNAEHLNKPVVIVAGGKQRWESVQNGVQAVKGEWVLIHDAARPFVSHSVIDAVLAKRYSYPCVVTVTPEVDTLRSFEGGDCAVKTIDRTKVVRVGTPQLFRVAALLQAFGNAACMECPPTDEAMLMECAGVDVGIAWGDPLNFKITTQSDLLLAEALCAYTH